MERVIDELEMISSPLAESEDSLISEMSTKNDVTRASWLEDPRAVYGDAIYGMPPPVPERDYSRLRSQVYRKRGEEFNMRRSKSCDRPRLPIAPPRPPTPEHHKPKTKFSRNSRYFIDRKYEKNGAIYATPEKKKKGKQQEIEGFQDELPKYLKSENENESSTTTPTQETVNVVKTSDFNSKVAQVEEKLNLLKMTREDSLTSLLKKELSKKQRKEEKLPGYVEPKDPIIKELQEFLHIEPDNIEVSSSSTSLQADDPKINGKSQFYSGNSDDLQSSSNNSSSSTIV